MPHPEHAVDVLTGSVDGLKLIVRGGMTVMARHRELGLTDHEYELIVRRSSSASRTTSSSRSSR